MTTLTLAGAVTAPALTYTLPSGRVVAVKPVTFRTLAIADRIDKASDVGEMAALCRELIRYLAPEVTDEEFLDLSPQQAMELSALASGMADAARAKLGNADAPAAAAVEPPQPAQTPPSAPPPLSA